MKQPKGFDLRDVIKTERKLLEFSGFYPRRNSDCNILYIFSAFVNALVSYLQLFSMIGQMVVDRRDLSKFTDTLLYFMLHFTFLCKLTNFIYHKKHLLTIEHDLCEEIFYSFCETQLKMLTKKIEACNMIAKVFRLSCILCIIFYTIVPVILIDDQKKLPLPGWLPYNIETFYYESAVFQTLSICISAYNHSSIDILTWKLITIASGELKILKDNLTNLEYKAGNIQDVKLTEAKFEDCVKHHNAVINLAHRVEFIFSKGIFMQFLSSVIIICLTGFQLIVVPIPSVHFVFLVMYFFCMMCQVAMYCWYGHEVMTTSDELGRFCYMSNWYESDIKIRKNIMMFLERTKKPITLTAGNFVTLSLTTLTGILRSSYSYFAVLQQVYQEDKKN